MEIGELGAILYWCEGSKREEDYRVEFVNSDPRIIRAFMCYLRSKGVEERRIRARMTLHIQDDEDSCKEYWKSVTNLDDSNFISTITKSPSFSKKPLPHGTLTVRYNSVELLRAIKKEIESLSERISSPLPLGNP